MTYPETLKIEFTFCPTQGTVSLFSPSQQNERERVNLANARKRIRQI